MEGPMKIELVENLHMEGGLFHLDNKHIRNSSFNKTILVYAGGPLQWDSCDFHDVKFFFNESCNNVAALLKAFGWSPQPGKIFSPQAIVPPRQSA